jgi:hypothetical protein
MSAKNGKSARIVAYVAKHPGCTRDNLRDALDVAVNNGLMAYCLNAGLVHAAGPVRWERYYPTAEQAAAAHAAIVAKAAAQRLAKQQAAWRESNLRKMAKRRAQGARAINTHPRTLVLAPGVTISPDVRVTIAPPMRDRWSV